LYDRNTWRGVDGPRLRDRRHPVVVLCVSVGALLALLYFAQTLNR
jgi:hypothetical protein